MLKLKDKSIEKWIYVHYCALRYTAPPYFQRNGKTVKPKTGIATKPVLDCHPSGTWPKARCAHLSIAENPEGPGMNPLK